MTQPSPLPLPQAPKTKATRHGKSLPGIAILAIIGALLLCLRLFGLVRPFSVPAGSMAPAVSSGDHVLMEGFSYLMHKPHRGDIVVFETDGLDRLPPAQLYIKRIVGEPGDRIGFSDRQLLINDLPVTLTNSYGKIVYALPPGSENQAKMLNVTVPDGHYYVLGDNSTNSFDSRFWGFLPASKIKGRISICYWPSDRISSVK